MNNLIEIHYKNSIKHFEIKENKTLKTVNKEGEK